VKFSYATELEPTMPNEWVSLLSEVAKKTLGRDDRTGEALAADLVRLSRAYTVDRDSDGWASVPRGKSAMAARLRFFLVRDFRKSAAPVDELLRAGFFAGRTKLRILDLGAGLGATTLGAAFALRRAGVTELEVVAVDSDAEALKTMEAVFAAFATSDTTSPFFPQITLKTRVSSFDDALSQNHEALDLVLAGFVWNELGENGTRTSKLTQALDRWLGPESAFLVLEPALHAQARALQELRDTLVASGEWTAVAPCTHDAPCPMLATPRDWCHASLPLALPQATAEIARAAGLRYERLSFSYATFAKRRTHPNSGWHRVVSEPLLSKGKREAILCGESALVRLRLLDREVSPSNGAFAVSERGDLLRLSKIDARIAPETQIERRPPTASRE
jgi:ribosomal protein RSM22 (predicted rRNA methylase)